MHCIYIFLLLFVTYLFLIESILRGYVYGLLREKLENSFVWLEASRYTTKLLIVNANYYKI